MKIINYVLIFMLALGNCAFAQNTDDITKAYMYVEQMPVFPGGNEKMYEFINKNIQYPDAAREQHIEGKVVAQFVVNIDGKISDIKILRSVAGGCDAEVIRVLNIMPAWTPGKQNGTNVPVYFNLPVTFKLGARKVYDTVEVMPQFPGGEKEMYQFFNQNIRYPAEAREFNIQGKVLAQFIVEPDGAIDSVKILEHVSGGCDIEALRVIQLMPKWIPGTLKGTPVPVYFQLPVEFRLADGNDKPKKYKEK